MAATWSIVCYNQQIHYSCLYSFKPCLHCKSPPLPAPPTFLYLYQGLCHNSIFVSYTGIHLRPYQIDGVNWLIERFHREHGCILGDEMGLGKTCQVISLRFTVTMSRFDSSVTIYSPISEGECYLSLYHVNWSVTVLCWPTALGTSLGWDLSVPEFPITTLTCILSTLYSCL